MGTRELEGKNALRTLTLLEEEALDELAGTGTSHGAEVMCIAGATATQWGDLLDSLRPAERVDKRKSVAPKSQSRRYHISIQRSRAFQKVIIFKNRGHGIKISNPDPTAKQSRIPYFPPRSPDTSN